MVEVGPAAAPGCSGPTGARWGDGGEGGGGVGGGGAGVPAGGAIVVHHVCFIMYISLE